MIQLVHSKFHPNLRHLFFRPNDLHHEPGKTNSPSSVLEEHKANPLWFNTWALPIVEVILPQSWDLKAMVSEATFCLEKSRANMLSTKTTCQQHSKKNAKQQIAITDSELQLLPHEDFSMKTHHKADTKDPALTNHKQPTLIPSTSMFQVHLCRCYP